MKAGPYATTESDRKAIRTVLDCKRGIINRKRGEELLNKISTGLSFSLNVSFIASIQRYENKNDYDILGFSKQIKEYHVDNLCILALINVGGP